MHYSLQYFKNFKIFDLVNNFYDCRYFHRILWISFISVQQKSEQLKFLTDIAKTNTPTMGGYMNELSAILMRVLQDPFVSVRLLANELLRFLIENFASTVHQFAEALILPLIYSSNHQQE